MLSLIQREQVYSSIEVVTSSVGMRVTVLSAPPNSPVCFPIAEQWRFTCKVSLISRYTYSPTGTFCSLSFFCDGAQETNNRDIRKIFLGKDSQCLYLTVNHSHQLTAVCITAVALIKIPKYRLQIVGKLRTI